MVIISDRTYIQSCNFGPGASGTEIQRINTRRSNISLRFGVLVEEIARSDNDKAFIKIQISIRISGPLQVNGISVHGDIIRRLEGGIGYRDGRGVVHSQYG